MKKKSRKYDSGSKPLVGLFAFQGDYKAHGRMIECLGHSVLEVRTSADLEICTHLIIPGGESTTYLKLNEFHNLDGAISRHIELARPVFGTCAGLILLAKEVTNPPQESFGLLDIIIERNSYGRQVDSFVTDLDIPAIGEASYNSIFIRAPKILSIGKNVEALASCEGDPVFVRQGNILGATFHPELTDDTRIHEYFMSMG